MKKYNITVHILFWILVITLLSAATLVLLLRGNDPGSVLPFLRNAELPRKEKVIVREVREVEREVDWFYFIASGYSANDPAQGTSDTTATGKKVEEGIIAVDPDVIPLGTKIEIKDLGVFTAEDTGGKIKGNRIDIYFDSKKDAKSFGRKGVWVRIIGNSNKLEPGNLYGGVPAYEDELESIKDRNLLAHGYGYQMMNKNILLSDD